MEDFQAIKHLFSKRIQKNSKLKKVKCLKGVDYSRSLDLVNKARYLDQLMWKLLNNQEII